MFRLSSILIVLAAAFSFAVSGHCAVASVPETDEMHLPDSSAYMALDARLDEYFKAMERESVRVKTDECNFIISSVSDTALRDHVAQKVYRYYKDSPVMGDEGVAVAVFDEWFAGGKARMASDVEMLDARIYVDFNRRSLLGCKAPQLGVVDMDGSPVELFDGQTDRYSVLYFYDADCVKCKVQSILLRNMLSLADYPADFYAFYTGDSSEQWKGYVSKMLDFSTDRLSVTHVWDPEVASDYQRKYGVLQTPRLFLISPGGTIIGRGLDADALSYMMEGIFTPKELTYGTEESEKLYDAIFSAEPVSSDEIRAVADRIAETTLSDGDTVLFRQMVGDMLYYLSGKTGEGMKEGLGYVVDTHILSRSDIWKSGDDSLKVVGMAEIMDDLLSKARPGTLVADVKVPGTIVTKRGTRNVERNLRKLRRPRNFIFFYAEGCNVCAEEKKAAPDKGVFMINMDELMASRPAVAARLFDAFDLTSLPYIIETDRSGHVVRRYISFK